MQRAKIRVLRPFAVVHSYVKHRNCVITENSTGLAYLYIEPQNSGTTDWCGATAARSQATTRSMR